MLTRRRFLHGVTSALIVPNPVKSYDFWHANTKEFRSVTPEAPAGLVYLLRDWRTPDQKYTVDPRLIARLFKVYDQFGGPIIIYSGFRTPKTNEHVRGAEGSLHMKARAVDFRIPDVPNKDIADWLYANINGGVGLYDTHIHMDTGRKRRWPRR